MEKMNLYDLRDIFNRANNFNLSEPKEITEKEIREVLFDENGKYTNEEKL